MHADKVFPIDQILEELDNTFFVSNCIYFSQLLRNLGAAGLIQESA